MYYQSRVLLHCVIPVQSSASLCFTCPEFCFTVFYLQVAVTTSNRVYTWGCHPHNLRYAASVLRRSHQMGQLSAPVGDGMEMFHLPALVDTTFLRSQIVQVGFILPAIPSCTGGLCSSQQCVLLCAVSPLEHMATYLKTNSSNHSVREKHYRDVSPSDTGPWL